MNHPRSNFFFPWNLIFDNPLAPEILSHVILCFLLAHINQLLQFFTHIGCVEKRLRLGSAELTVAVAHERQVENQCLQQVRLLSI